MKAVTLTVVGRVDSSLRALSDAPRQGDEGAPDATILIEPAFAPALAGLRPGDEIVLLTWLDRADRRTLAVHPRDDASAPLTGVFATRSPDRPNPIGLHRVTVRTIDGARLRVGPLEAIDGTPIVDLKIVWKDS
jgi:tRNA-Thr(GGU) m(6)t(6)A37 methyltransferase TsaA